MLSQVTEKVLSKSQSKTTPVQGWFCAGHGKLVQGMHDDPECGGHQHKPYAKANW
jgi:hypothetical protein